MPKYVSSLIKSTLFLGLVTLGTRLVLPLGIQRLGRLWPHVLSGTVSLVATGTAGGSPLLLQTALIVELALDGSVLPGGTDILETRRLLLPAVLAIVTQFDAGLALQGLAEASVDILGGGAPQGVAGGGVGGFLAVATEDSGVVGLADFIGVGGVRVAGRCAARRVGLQVEFGALVCLIDLAAGLVLSGELAIGKRDLV